MSLFLEVPRSCEPVRIAVEAGLARVVERFDRQLMSDLPPVTRLTRHVERYRGKMLRPILTLVSGLATLPPGEGGGPSGLAERITDAHVTVAAVCEMIHMATLVHDDVLDEADTRRAGDTVNHLHGNEMAVILGDYLIASAYHLCSQLDRQATALAVAHVAMTLCAGELLQLSRRDDFSLDEPTYFEIIERKTASLIALACRLGAECSGAPEGICRRLERFGVHIGAAFQIQDDLLDVSGRRSAIGKPVGQDLGKGKLTLPMIHHLASIAPAQRGRSLELLARAAGDPGADGAEAARQLAGAMEVSRSLDHARAVAHERVREAKAQLEPLPASPAKDMLLIMADAVVGRSS